MTGNSGKRKREGCNHGSLGIHGCGQALGFWRWSLGGKRHFHHGGTEARSWGKTGLTAKNAEIP